MPLFPYLPTPSILQSSDAQIAQTASIRIDATRTGANRLEIRVIGPDGKPVTQAQVQIALTMVEMDMGVARPKAQEVGGGLYVVDLILPMSGKWRAHISVVAADGAKAERNVELDTEGAMKMTDAMAGRLGSWGMAREGSGTSWLPDSSPSFMDMLPPAGRYDLSVMGYFTYNYTSSNGPRGDSRSYSNSMPMLMARRETGGGIIGMDLMMSLDPIFNGEVGYPDLFQTGETAHGVPLVDHQHPHNLISEVAGSYSHPISRDVGAFLYAGPIGEPCLGGPTFMHRPSGDEIPEAPISHHWFDSTHISSGVVTAGLNNRRWQIEASSFNGQEPGENRYLPQPISLNSAATRLTFNPSRNLSFNASYGFLYSPEDTSPGVDQHRLTAAAIWSMPLPNRDNLSTSLVFGRRIEEGTTSDAYLIESTYLSGPNSIFLRFENVDEFELYDIPAGTYRVDKVLFGGVRNFSQSNGYQLGLGAYMGLYAYPSSLDFYYGRSPVTLGVFLRLRPARMQ
jgi:hypothetical protein